MSLTLRFSDACVAALVGFLLMGCESALHAANKDSKVEFDRDIRPIFSDNCFHCHGPDEKARKAKLRLDTKEGAFRVRDGKAVIISGKSNDSELIRRVTNKDPEEVMPPPESNHKLTAAQIELLRKWIDQGAEWASHWAYKKITRPALPGVKNRAWAANEIDRFVLARLEKEQLAPSPRADGERLLRRITFDLTGLPPTPAELDAFLKDKSPRAYEKVIERLLKSPAYGERMAVEWLDIARFSDTYGYQMDAPRPMWPYRDWVIRAFNENLPFDQFVTWQLAGDLLPNATRDQRLATAFNRLHNQNEEGGIVEEEYRVAYVQDRVDTFGAAFIGLTLQCAHCHDHKFDPISMRDFYSLFAMFQNIDESGQNPYTGFVDYMPAPTLALIDEQTEARLNKIKSQILTREREQPAFRESARLSFAKWLGSKPASNSIPGLEASFSFDELKDNKASNAVDANKPANAHEGPKLVAGKFGQAAELNGENGFSIPGIGHYKRTEPFSAAIWVRTESNAARYVILHHTKAPADAGNRGYELLLENGHVSVGIHHQWPGNSIKIQSRESIATNEWVHLGFTYDGSSHASGLHLYINGRIAETDMLRDHLWRDITYATGEPELQVGYRFRDSGFKQGQVDELKIFNRALTSLEMTDIAGLQDFREAWGSPEDKLSARQREGLLDYYIANVYAPAAQFRSELAALRREENQILTGAPQIMVMEEMVKPKPAFILKRGAYDQPGEPVSANTPAALPPMPADAPRNRLGLAKWLVSPENPLFARVTVNRAWQMMFGRGLVETIDNFGSRGAVPTHPELLDWLAADFMASGWDYKGLFRKIALSATYQQSSRAAPEMLARDPENELLARGPARRLTAEMLRDQALATSGLLVEKQGGPSVRPYQPPGLWEIAMGNPRYEQEHGPNLYRRSLYTFWKRTVPPPSMLVFDAPERNQCLVHRQSTSTPLQGLYLLNDMQITEAARFISQRMLSEGGTDLEHQVRWAFRLVTSRSPSDAEAEILLKLYREQREIFANEVAATERLLTVGEAPNSPALSPIELAAGAVLAEAILNHDEALMRR